jgi:phosphoglycolate phosphatase
MLPPFEAILFDFDGTLGVLNLDFAAMRSRVLTFTLAQALPPEVFEGLDILELIAHATILLHQRHPESAVVFARDVEQILQEMEVMAAQHSGLLPGIEVLLGALQRGRIGVGIVTRNCNAAVRVMFPQLDYYCQAFFPRDRVTRVKPHPEHLQAALDHLGAPPTRTLMVGDGALDMQAGKALGMFSIGVLSGSGTRDRLLQHGADLVLESATDLLQYLPGQGRIA